MQRDKATLLQWLGYKSDFNWSENTVLGGFVGFLLGLFVLALLIVSVVVVSMMVVAVFDSGLNVTRGKAEVIRNLGLLLAATVGLPFLVWRSFVAQKQVNVAEQGHITDRINEAVNGLGAEKVVKKLKRTPRYRKDGDNWLRDGDGNPLPALRPDGEHIVDVESHEESIPNLEVRIGSIYALERIALDSARDHIQIMEIFCAYIRENAPMNSLGVSEPDIVERPKLRIDIQAVISVIGRRNKRQIELEWANKYRLDLRYTNLSGGDFRHGNFSGALFHLSRLEAASFDHAILIGTQFNSCLLNHSKFLRAELRGTIFNEAVINRPTPVKGGFNSSINMGNIHGVSLIGADISAIDYLGEADALQRTFGSQDTILADEMETERKDLNELRRDLGVAKHFEDQALIQSLQEKIAEHGLNGWFEYNKHDSGLGFMYLKFMKKMELSDFPYFD